MFPTMITSVCLSCLGVLRCQPRFISSSRRFEPPFKFVSSPHAIPIVGLSPPTSPNPLVHRSHTTDFYADYGSTYLTIFE
ncbi:hypothetical protein B0H11DRAFT_1970507 [Mycena galericulata]|nr:hypothetical protein B0H11DRAFT_1970507 [Mycena galericulata]